jgi:hypothetical protein
VNLFTPALCLRGWKANITQQICVRLHSAQGARLAKVRSNRNNKGVTVKLRNVIELYSARNRVALLERFSETQYVNQAKKRIEEHLHAFWQMALRSRAG